MHTTRFGHSSLLVLTAAYFLRTASAQTPPGFKPVTSKHLTVTYGTAAINPAGITIPGNEVIDAPSLGWAGTYTTYVAIMMDFSVETNGSTESNTTLLHWTLAGLSSSDGTTTLTSQQAEIAPYFPPDPPAGQTHIYGVFLYNEPADFAVPADYIPFFKNLTAPGSSVFNRVGFNLTNFVAKTGLGAPVAANWFLVSTPNATESSTMTTNSTLGATVSATMTTTGANTGSTSFKSSSPSATQSKSDAIITGVEWMMVAVGTSGLLVGLF